MTFERLVPAIWFKMKGNGLYVLLAIASILKNEYSLRIEGSAWYCEMQKAKAKLEEEVQERGEKE